MATYLPVPGTLPDGWCPATWQTVLNQFAALLPIEISGEDEILVQEDTPTVDERDKVWIKTLDVAPWVESINIWVPEIPPAGAWRPIPGQPVYFVDTGAADAMVITTGENMNSELFLTGRIFMVKANNTNTGAVTLAVDTVTAKSVKKQNNLDMEAGDFVAGQILLLAYDPVSNVFEVVNTLTPPATPAPVVIDTTGLTKMVTVSEYANPGLPTVIEHGIGNVPSYYRVGLYCETGGDGYVHGDEIPGDSVQVGAGLPPFTPVPITYKRLSQLWITFDAINVYTKGDFGNSGGTQWIYSKYGPLSATAGDIALDPNNWKVILRAFYLSPKVPSIDTQPVSLTKAAGTNAVFTVVASGDTPLDYQWQRNGVNIFDGGRLSGTATASLTITGVVDGVPPGGDEANYSCNVTSSIGTISSNTASLTVT